MKTALLGGFLLYLCGFLGVLSFSAVPSTATFAQNTFCIQIISAKHGYFGAEQKPHGINYKEIINLMFNFFKVENRPFGRFSALFMRLFRRFKLKTPKNNIFSKFSSFIDKLTEMWYNILVTRIEYFIPKTGKYFGKKCFLSFLIPLLGSNSCDNN